MGKLDLSKFRFRIGDTVLYAGLKCRILAYYFDNGRIGYTINVGYAYIGSHDGNGYSIDKNGDSINPNCDTCLYVGEHWVEPIK